MSYKAGEAAALTLARTLSEWDANNSVSLANDTNNVGVTLIENGKSDHYLELGPGPFTRERDSVGADHVVNYWMTTLTIYVLEPLDQEAAESRLTTYVGNLIAVLDGRLELSSTSGVVESMVTGGSGIAGGAVGTTGERRQTLLEESYRQSFIVQELTLEWQEHVSVTQND